ncbi:ankyrin repeat domain-containing protein [Cardinium endosymbiont of Sogatella furcifera]|uniref:ankyrin repeat domain-containing protein n=1 Tax=Cardinium endosymbiont of Sogatella furcifera TaxID=650378 RepID=UPI0013B3CE6C|nr:ankyrin repeat domain-containing protein [Cardinium endosymbiont of Sogatella furcifera]
MKKYMQYSVILLIGLLGLQTLSACVHTRAAVGCRGSVCTEQVLDLDMERSGDSSQVKIKKPNTTAYMMLGCLLGCIVTGCLMLPVFHSYFDYYVGSSNTFQFNRSNHCTHATTPSQFILDVTTMSSMVNMTTEKERFVIDAIGTSKWNAVPARPLDDQVMDDLISEFSIEKIAEWLAKGLDINAPDENLGYTLLMHAVWYNSRHIVQCLIEKGADVNAQGKDGATSLMIAVKQDDAPMVSFLIEHGADPCIADHQGNTARSLAQAIAKHTQSKTIIVMLDRAQPCVA